MTLENSRLSKFVFVCMFLFFMWGGLHILTAPADKTPNQNPARWIIPFMIPVLVVSMWSALKAKVEVDAQGISTTNGFLQQNVRWSEVSAYYFLTSDKNQPQPVLLGADGAVLFRGFPSAIMPVSAVLEQQKAVCDLIESRLKGKEIESPFLHAKFWIPVGPDVDPTQQSIGWKIMHVLTWLAYLTPWLFVLNHLHEYRFEVKTGPVSTWVSDWFFPGNQPGPLAVALLFLYPVLPPSLLVLWRRRQAHRHLLPFRYVSPTTPPQNSQP